MYLNIFQLIWVCTKYDFSNILWRLLLPLRQKAYQKYKMIFFFTISGLSVIFYFKLHDGYCISDINTMAFVYYIALVLTHDGEPQGSWSPDSGFIYGNKLLNIYISMKVST